MMLMSMMDSNDLCDCRENIRRNSTDDDAYVDDGVGNELPSIVVNHTSGIDDKVEDLLLGVVPQLADHLHVVGNDRHNTSTSSAGGGKYQDAKSNGSCRCCPK